MSLTNPVTKNQRPASFESADNLSRLLQVNPHGGKEQVATRLSLEYFARIQELQPGYFDGIKSWAKSCVIYACGGAAALAMIGLGACAVYKLGDVLYEIGYLPHVLIGSGFSWAVASEFGCSPLKTGVVLTAVATRDAAERAAKWSSRQDTRTIEERAKEAKECHTQIISQLILVFDDVAQYLKEIYEESLSRENAAEMLDIKKKVDRLKEKLPYIETILQEFKLSRYEIETIMEQIKGMILFIQTQSYELKTSCDKRNAKLLAATPASEIRHLAVPTSLRERISLVNRNAPGILDRFSGATKAALAGLKIFMGLATLGALGSVSCIAYKHGWDTVKNLSRESISNFALTHRFASISTAFTLLGSTLYLSMQKWREETSLINRRSDFV